MTEGALVDRLDRTVDAILKHSDATAALRDPELAPLARVAADLRYCPGPAFTARLRAQLERRTAMSTALIPANVREGFTTVTPYVRVSEAGLVDFLSRAFDAEETFSTRGSGGGIHREVRIGNSMIMIGEGGTGGVMPVRPAAFHVYVKDVDAAFERVIAAGAVSLGMPEDRPYGERAGFVRDALGNHWYIATHRGPSYVPEGLSTVTPFLHTRGTAQYVEFLKRAFGAVEEGRRDVADKVRYARLRIGNAAIELGEAEGPAPAMPSGFYLYVSDADSRFAQAVAAGATALTPPSDQPYGDRMGAVEDSAGNQWFIARPA